MRASRNRGGACARALVLVSALVFPFDVAYAQTPEPVLVPPIVVGEGCHVSTASEGRVIVRVVVDEHGVVTEAGLEGSIDPATDDAVSMHVRTMTFEPALRDGIPTAARIRLECALTVAAPETPSQSDSDTSIEAAVPPPVAPALDDEPEVGVHATVESDAERLTDSAEAVDVVSTETGRRESADLGEVLARQRGVSIRRAGGLGSEARISLSGLTDDQIRFFLDGIPIELMGYTNGIANVPVNLLEHVEIYRGVLPARFGADALGGAFNLATDQDISGTGASASIELGSFGTYRLTAAGRHLHVPSGFLVRTSAYFDATDNDYLVDVEVADDTGALTDARVRRFHDAYRAYGGVLELGLVNRRYANRLIVRAFANAYDKELQNNLVMSVPYGEARYGARAYGVGARYEHAPTAHTSLRIVGGYARIATDFLDVSEHVYDWFGRQIRERREPGEINGQPYDQTTYQGTAFVRAGLEWSVASGHSLRLSLSPSVTTRTGRDRTTEAGSRDPLDAERLLATMVTGIEYEGQLLGGRLTTIVFAKDYVYAARSVEVLPGDIEARRDVDDHFFGVGFSLRHRLTEAMSIEGSYERATRLPRPDEVFGNGVLIGANLGLAPETSHNANLELAVETEPARLGTLRLDVRLFARFADELITLLGNDRFYLYQNVFAARSLGVELACGWTSPGAYVTLDANATFQDFRNASSQGAFGSYDGDRIPNRPWLFANGTARLDFADAVVTGDAISFALHTRFVYAFFRGWESVGLRDSKQRIDSQTSHTIALTYTVHNEAVEVASTIEAQNITNARMFDLFGVQRPGRAFYFKTTLTY